MLNQFKLNMNYYIGRILIYFRKKIIYLKKINFFFNMENNNSK